MKRILVGAALLAAATFGGFGATAHAATKAETVKKVEPVIATVVEGDSLSSIAETYNTTWMRIYDVNDSITNPDVINPGDQLRIPAADEQLTDRALPQQTTYAASVSYTRTTTVANTQAQTATASSPTDGNTAKAYIYARESGNNPNATNAKGCYGIGQDCNGVVRSQCGADYTCQDEYFTAYATRRYGSWEGALAFWQNHGWW